MTQVTRLHTVSLRFTEYALTFALLLLLGGCGDAGDAQTATEEEPTGEISQALHCPGSDYLYVSDGSSAASLWLHYRCSDGRARVTGTLYDIKCDNRSAHLELRFYHEAYYGLYQTETNLPVAHGCNRSVTIDKYTSDNTPFVYAYVFAQNSWPGDGSKGAKDWLEGR